MRVFIKTIVVCALIVMHQAMLSQSTEQAIAAGNDVNVLYRNESTFGVFIHSRGFGANYRRLHHVTGKLKRFIEVEGLSMNHPKQTRIKPKGGKSYYYGKINGACVLRAGFGLQRTLYERAERKSIEVRSSYVIGPSFCFTKPVYLQIATTSPNGETDVSNVQADPDNQNQNNIIGRAPLIYGFNQLSVHPGLYGKIAFSFEFGELRSTVKTLETGVIADYYPGPVKMMAHNPAESYIITLYVGFNIGRRWF